MSWKKDACPMDTFPDPKQPTDVVRLPGTDNRSNSHIHVHAYSALYTFLPYHSLLPRAFRQRPPPVRVREHGLHVIPTMPASPNAVPTNVSAVHTVRSPYTFRHERLEHVFRRPRPASNGISEAQIHSNMMVAIIFTKIGLHAALCNIYCATALSGSSPSREQKSMADRIRLRSFRSAATTWLSGNTHRSSFILIPSSGSADQLSAPGHG
ncbi:hypothetical protein BD779DRAFT_232005 [Infundibulicybe gibba]|nr:hypothetical protein BD779DRAFT_232005 [Infundibulicybe gibba]